MALYGRVTLYVSLLQKNCCREMCRYPSPFAIEKVPILNLPKVLCGPEGEGYTLRRLVVILCEEGNTHRG